MEKQKRESVVSRLLAWIEYKLDITKSSPFILFNRGYREALKDMRKICNNIEKKKKIRIIDPKKYPEVNKID